MLVNTSPDICFNHYNINMYLCMFFKGYAFFLQISCASFFEAYVYHLQFDYLGGSQIYYFLKKTLIALQVFSFNICKHLTLTLDFIVIYNL